MGRAQCRWVAAETNEWRGAKWTQTNHDLDFIFEKNGIFYGVEVKNALGRIERDEIDVKVSICRHLGLVPFFVVRWMART